MSLRKDVLFAVVSGIAVLSNNPSALAQEVTSELPLVSNYNYQKDPYLLEWTFLVEDEVKQPVVPVVEMTQEEKVLARWKEKQQDKWDRLQIGKQLLINASAYTAAADECGKDDGITASGLKVEEGRTLACPPEYPFGTVINIEGIGERRCEDRGGAIKGNKFDIYMETKTDAFAFGRRNLTAEIVQ